jgi:hypothetical protein
VTGIYRSPWGWDVLANFGYYRIAYIDPSQIDCFGYFYRAGFRGNLLERLSVEALVGYQTIETDFFPDQHFIREGTAAGHVNLRYEISENMNLFFDAARGYVFWGNGDPFQLLDSFTAYFRYDWTETFWIAIRGVFEHAHTALDVSRKYYGGSINANYKFSRNFAANIGATFRAGDTDNMGGKVKFTDVIFGGGLAITF